MRSPACTLNPQTLSGVVSDLKGYGRFKLSIWRQIPMAVQPISADVKDAHCYKRLSFPL